MEGPATEEELLSRINIFKGNLYELIRIYEKEGKDEKILWSSYEVLKKEIEDALFDLNFGDHLKQIIWTCPCIDKSRNMKEFENEYSSYSVMSRQIHDSYLFCCVAGERIEVICGEHHYTDFFKKILITDEPRVHIERLLKSVNEKIKKKMRKH